MSLKLKALGAIFLIAAVWMAAEAFVFDRIIFDGFLRLERADAIKNMDRVRNALANELDHLDAVAHNASSSDELYRFAGSQERLGAARYFSWEALRAAHVNLAAMFDEAGGLIACGAFDLDSRETLRLSPCFASLALGTAGDFGVPDPMKPVKGLIMTEAGPMLAAVRPILNAQGWGPPRGAFLMGRLLTASLLETLQNEVRLDFSIAPCHGRDQTGQALPDPGAVSEGIFGGPTSLRPINNDVLQAQAVLADLRGKPALELTLDLKRDVSLMGGRLLKYVAWAFAGLSCVMAVILMLLLQRIVVGPLTRFAGHVASLGDNPESSEAFPLRRMDEIGDAVRAVNALLEARRAAVSRLRENQALLRAMLAGVPLDVWARDREQRCIMQSNISVQHWGDLTGKPFAPGQAAPETLEAWSRNNEVALAGGTARREFTAQVGDGSERVFQETVAPIVDEGEIKGILGVNVDLTEERRLVAELRKAKDEAEVASRSKSEFLANMSHEIRTPLNSVLGMLQLAGMTPHDPTQAEYLQTALASGRGLLTVIGDILDLSKIEAGKIELNEQVFDLRDMLRGLEAAFALQAARKGLGLRSDFHPGIPEVVRGDAGRLRQILFNLIGNALKFTDRGGVAVEIAAASRPGETGAIPFRFTVRDSGVGVDPAKLDEIFEPFVQADGSYRRNRSGSGLGLAIVKRLTELMGGVVTVTSSAGAGSSFTCEIPLRPATAAEAAALRIAEPQPDGNAEEPLKTLVVEDETINRIMTVKMLEKLGHAAMGAANGHEALELIGKRDFDCVFMDIQMPELDGLETTRLIRNMPGPGKRRQVYVVALTAHAMKGDREEFLKAGMDDYIAKPLEMEDLFLVLSKARRHRARSE